MTTPGTTYRIRFALAGNPDGVPVVKTLMVTFAGVSKTFHFDTTGHDYTDMGWTMKHFDVLATDATTRLQFQSLDDTTGGPALDSIRVTVVADNRREERTPFSASAARPRSRAATGDVLSYRVPAGRTSVVLLAAATTSSG